MQNAAIKKGKKVYLLKRHRSSDSFSSFYFLSVYIVPYA